MRKEDSMDSDEEGSQTRLHTIPGPVFSVQPESDGTIGGFGKSKSFGSEHKQHMKRK